MLLGVNCYRRFGRAYRSHLQGVNSTLGLLDPWIGTDRLSRNVSNWLPTNAAWHPRSTKTSLLRSWILKSSKSDTVEIVLQYVVLLKIIW